MMEICNSEIPKVPGQRWEYQDCPSAVPKFHYIGEIIDEDHVKAVYLFPDHCGEVWCVKLGSIITPSWNRYWKFLEGQEKPDQ